jgi:hypothetical protein
MGVNLGDFGVLTKALLGVLFGVLEPLCCGLRLRAAFFRVNDVMKRVVSDAVSNIFEPFASLLLRAGRQPEKVERNRLKIEYFRGFVNTLWSIDLV